MGTGKGQSGASKGKGRTNTAGFNPVEGESFSPPYSSAAERKTARKQLSTQGRPGHIRSERRPNPNATTRPGRRKN